MKEYRVAIRDDSGKFAEFIKVMGERVKINGLDDYVFFVHGSVNYGSKYTVSENSTGMYIASHNYKKHAISIAKQRIEDKGIDEVKKMIEKHKRD